jgi:putative dehydrogenase
MRVGVIGLGAMGMGAAISCVRAGLETVGCDLSPAAREAFTAAGGVAVSSPDAMGAVDAVLTLVVNAEQTEGVLFGDQGLASILKPGAVVLAGATTPPDYPPTVAAKLAELGVLFIDAPVSGGAVKALAGEMTVMAAGAEAAFEKAGQMLDAVAEKVYRIGDTPGQGAAIKMINQLLAGVHIAAMAEAFALASRAGADLETVYEVISNAAGGSWMFENRGPSIVEGDYAPKSAVDIFVKDLGIVLDAGRKMTFPLPLAATAHQQFLAASAGGHGRENDSAVIKVFQKLTGIDLPTKAGEA